MFIPDVTTPALVQLIRMAKLDASLPSSASESFNFVFETNSFSLDAILPKFCQIDSYLIQDEKAYSFSSSPISNLFVRSFGHEEKSRLFGISQFSAWVSGFTLPSNSALMEKLLKLWFDCLLVPCWCNWFSNLWHQRWNALFVIGKRPFPSAERQPHRSVWIRNE